MICEAAAKFLPPISRLSNSVLVVYVLLTSVLNPSKFCSSLDVFVDNSVTVLLSAFLPISVCIPLIDKLFESAVCFTSFTVFFSVSTVLPSAFLLTVSDNDIMDAEFSSTVCLSSLKTDDSTFEPMSVSSVVVLLLRLDNSSSVSIFQEEISASNRFIPSISPFMSIMSCKAFVTSLSLISTHS